MLCIILRFAVLHDYNIEKTKQKRKNKNKQKTNTFFNGIFKHLFPDKLLVSRYITHFPTADKYVFFR